MGAKQNATAAAYLISPADGEKKGWGGGTELFIYMHIASLARSLPGNLPRSQSGQNGGRRATQSPTGISIVSRLAATLGKYQGGKGGHVTGLRRNHRWSRNAAPAATQVLQV